MNHNICHKSCLIRIVNSGKSSFFGKSLFMLTPGAAPKFPEKVLHIGEIAAH